LDTPYADISDEVNDLALAFFGAHHVAQAESLAAEAYALLGTSCLLGASGESIVTRFSSSKKTRSSCCGRVFQETPHWIVFAASKESHWRSLPRFAR